MLRHSEYTPAKSGVGICTPLDTHSAYTALAVFLCAKHGYTSSMVGWAGLPKGRPVL
ncbi:TPA: ash family protein [Providencia rettgeri]|nr:ash family protein [Providencia rettgeri]